MLKVYYDKKNDAIHWHFGDSGGFIRPVYDDEECICGFNVYHVPMFGGEETLDSFCNTLPEAMAQLEMVSI